MSHEAHGLVSPFRSAAVMTATRQVRIKVFLDSVRGNQVLRVDVKVWVFVLAHTLTPLALCLLDTPVRQHITAALNIYNFGQWRQLPGIMMLTGILAAAFVYWRLYRSDPGWIWSGAPAPGMQLQRCRWCSEVPSLRSRHDKHTGQCIHKPDHFCWWLSTSIGDLNHARFWSLLLLEVLLLLCVLYATLPPVVTCLNAANSLSHPNCHNHNALTMIMLLLISTGALVVFVMIGHLLLLHTYLAATNQTTVELLKGKSMGYLRPYYQHHDGPQRYQVTLPELLALIVHHWKGTGPPMPFSEGMVRNLWVFFVAKKPYDYRLQYAPPAEPAQQSVDNAQMRTDELC